MFLVDNARLGLARYMVSSAGEVARRRLSDCREFDIVERLWKPADLEREVAAVGWSLTACTTANGSPPRERRPVLTSEAVRVPRRIDDRGLDRVTDQVRGAAEVVDELAEDHADVSGAVTSPVEQTAFA